MAIVKERQSHRGGEYGVPCGPEPNWNGGPWVRGPACHVLVLDDQDRFLAFAAQELARIGVPLHVTLARSSQEAEDHLDSAKPADVALIDIDLGEEQGPAVARSLAATGRVRQVVLMSQHDLPVYRTLAAAGHVRFLPKKDFVASYLAELLGPIWGPTGDGPRAPSAAEGER